MTVSYPRAEVANICDAGPLADYYYGNYSCLDGYRSYALRAVGDLQLIPMSRGSPSGGWLKTQGERPAIPQAAICASLREVPRHSIELGTRLSKFLGAGCMR